MLRTRRTLADRVRGEIFAARLHCYKIAAKIDLHPVRLSRYLNGREPLTEALAQKIRAAIADELRDGGSGGA